MRHTNKLKDTNGPSLLHGLLLAGLLLPAGFASAIMHDRLDDTAPGLDFDHSVLPDGTPVGDLAPERKQVDLFNQDLFGVMPAGDRRYIDNI
jgi:hypothetical protein